jgi:hypothetical protein
LILTNQRQERNNAMNAALATFPGRTTAREQDAVVLARRGDERALVDVFDAVIYDVYSYAYLETGSVEHAERIADAASESLVWIVRDRGVTSTDQVRQRLLASAARRVEALRAAEFRTEKLQSMRAYVRHAFLAGVAAFAAGYGVILGLG